jgi:hypothetical protein
MRSPFGVSLARVGLVALVLPFTMGILLLLEQHGAVRDGAR